MRNHKTPSHEAPQTNDIQKEWFTSEEAARYLCISVGALRNMTHRGKIPIYKLGRRTRFRLEDLKRLIVRMGSR